MYEKFRFLIFKSYDNSYSDNLCKKNKRKKLVYKESKCLLKIWENQFLHHFLPIKRDRLFK